MRNFRLHILAVPLVLMACSAERDLPEESVEIGPAAESQEAISVLSVEPILSLGGTESGPGSDLYGVVGAVRLEDGRIFIADRAQRILAWDSNGNYIGSFGREGQGPGEFRSMNWMKLRPPDTLVVNDGAENRISLFTSDGEFVTSFRARSAVGMFEDGTVATLVPIPGGGYSPDQAFSRSTRGLTRADREGNVLDSIAQVPGAEIFAQLSLGWPQLLRSTYEVVPNAIYLSTGERSEILRYEPEGGDPQVIPIPQNLTPVTSDDLFGGLEALGLAERVVRSDLDAFPEGRTLPAITDLILSSTGDLWARETIADAAAPLWYWSIVNTENNEVTRRVVTPGRIRPLQIGDGWLLGVTRDELGVESVQLYSLN
jgi:hypothetical protein